MLEGVGIAVPGPSHHGSVRASGSNGGGGGGSTRQGTNRNSMASVEVHEKIEMNWI